MKKKQKKYSEFYKKSYKKTKKAQKEDLEDLNSLLENESYTIGTFRRNERGFGFVNIGDDENEIFIAPKFTLNAADGDEVLIKILDNIKLANKKQEGKILKVKKHNLDTVVGIFKKSKDFGFVIPENRGKTEDIYIPRKKSKDAKNNQKVVVKITRYSNGENKSEGEIVEVLGYKDEAGVDMLSLIKEYKLSNEFPENVIKEAQAISQTIDENNIAQRVDLRGEQIFTIDGEDAKDLDDAVNVKENDDGTYTLGVHIADVSYYVKSGSKLDKEAIKRGTSIYMMDRVIPMLPKELSNGICSLNEAQDRFTISCIMKIDQNGKVVDYNIFKSVIKTTRRMNYHEVENIFKYADGEENKEIQKTVEICKEYIPHFLRMRKLKDILKARRDRNGSLNLDIPESKIVLDENGVAIDVKKYDYLESNEVIEQFMLTANETVAKHFYYLQAPFIYRVHDIPEPEKVEELNKFLFNLGYKIRGVKKDDKESIHPKAFAQVLDEVKGKPEEKVISNLILRTLKVAKYESENNGHFGIASKNYCHFTSPIRRYPDLFIHRVISSYLKHNYNINEELRKKYEIEAVKYAESSSECEKVAKKVERDAEDIKKAEFMKSKIGEVYDGIVSSVTSFGMFVELENTVEGLVKFDNLGDEYFVYDDVRKKLIGDRTKKTYGVGDKVKIRVIGADKQLRNIDFEIVENKENSTEEL